MNQQMIELVVRPLRGVRRSVAWWSAGVVVFIVVNLAFWPSLENSGALDGLDQMDALLEAFGAQNITTPAGYMDGQLYALLLPLLLAAMMIAVVSAMTAGDESAGRLELIHALPVGRRTVWLGRWLASTAALVLVTVVAALAAVVCMPLFSLDEVAVGRVLGASAACAVLAAFHGSIVYAIAAGGASRAASAGTGIAVLVAGYVASFVLPLANSLAKAREFSPWYWALGEQPVTDGVSAGRMVVVAAVTVVLVVVGEQLIDRRDIRTA
jgi:ABC-2 type transport system permease protein